MSYFCDSPRTCGAFVEPYRSQWLVSRYTTHARVFLSGSIPKLYREVYEVACLGSSSKVGQDLWMKCMKTASLSDATLEQVGRETLALESRGDI